MITTNYSTKLIAVLAFVLFSQSFLAQRNFSLYHLEGSPQRHYINPAFRAGSNVNVSFPVFGMHSIGLSHSGFTINDLFHERAQDDSLEVRPEEAIRKMARLNHINFDVKNELFGFGFRVDDNYFSFSVMNRFQFNFLYPKDLFKFVVEGNGRDLLGERADFDELGLNMNSYIEYAVGYNRKLFDDLMIGARVKLISGIANINTSRSRIGIYTDPETFDLTLDGTMRINTTNVAAFGEDEDLSNEFNPLDYITGFSNFGIGVDAGASYEFEDKLTLSASVTDLGFINWQSNNQNYETNDISYTFRGVEMNGFFDGDDDNDAFDNLLDTLGNVFNQYENTDSYSTSLYTRFFIGGSYKLNEQLRATAMLYNEIVNRRYRAGLNVGVNAKLGEWLSASLQYGYFGRSWSNVGFGLHLRGGPIQYFVAVDNVLIATNPFGQKNAHFSTGISFMIGKPDKEKEAGNLKLDDTEEGL